MEGFRLLELPFDQVVGDAVDAAADHVREELSILLHAALSNVIAQSFGCRCEGAPVREDVDQHPIVNRDHPVVREMLVADFPHLGVLVLEHLGAEGHQYEDHLRLHAERYGAVLGLVAEHGDHVVDVVVLHRVYECFDQLGAQFEPVVIVTWVLIGDFLQIRRPIIQIACRLAQFGHFLRAFSQRGVLVAHIACDDALAGNRRNETVEEQQHHTVVVHSLDNETLALFVHEHGLHRIVDVLAVEDVGDVLVHVDPENIDTLEELVEALDNVHVVVLEPLVHIIHFVVALDSLIVCLLVLDIIVGEKDLQVLLVLKKADAHFFGSEGLTLSRDVRELGLFAFFCFNFVEEEHVRDVIRQSEDLG